MAYIIIIILSLHPRSRPQKNPLLHSNDNASRASKVTLSYPIPSHKSTLNPFSSSTICRLPPSHPQHPFCP